MSQHTSVIKVLLDASDLSSHQIDPIEVKYSALYVFFRDAKFFHLLQLVRKLHLAGPNSAEEELARQVKIQLQMFGCWS